jgi:putative hydrolase of the HAD superfamily
MLKAVLLDMDDLLIVNQVLYENAEFLLYGYLRNFGVTRDEAKEVFNRVDKELYQTYGYTKKRMPASFEAVLKHFVPAADEDMVRDVRSFAEEIFTVTAALKPGVAQAVELLAKNYPIYIVTIGDQDVQQSRFDRCIPFKDKIKRVFIVPKKDKSTYEGVLAELGLKPNEVIMVGDSLKSDIIPSTQAGIEAIWVEAHNSPLHETAQEWPKERAYKASSLLEAARRVVNHGTAKPQPRNPGFKPPRAA